MAAAARDGGAAARPLGQDGVAQWGSAGSSSANFEVPRSEKEFLQHIACCLWQGNNGRGSHFRTANVLARVVCHC